jgi:dTDP-4-amino-4,6-dideoxygalactose transaminase
MEIQMVDLHGQYLSIKDEIDAAIEAVIHRSSFIKGPFVAEFEESLADWLGVNHVVGVGNGTDALQIALMALGIEPGDEVIAPSFTFVATTEAAALLGAVPVFVDIDAPTFNIDPSAIEELISDRTRAIVPVHLYGQPCDMNPIMNVAAKHGLPVIEDNAQSIGSRYGVRYAGTFGDLGTLSFFPSKNLGAYGDGGAVMTNDSDLAERVRMIANHGSKRKYENEMVGVNSRLDAMQASILSAKLRHLDAFIDARVHAADRYDEALRDVPDIEIPPRAAGRTHVFHQYTIRVSERLPGARDALSAYLREKGIPHAVYYPVPVHRLPVTSEGVGAARTGDMAETDRASREVLSLPMHTELTDEAIGYIAEHVTRFIEAYEPALTE